MVVTSTAAAAGGGFLEHAKFNRAIVATAAFRMTLRFRERRRGMVFLSLQRAYMVRHCGGRNYGRQGASNDLSQGTPHTSRFDRNVAADPDHGRHAGGQGQTQELARSPGSQESRFPRHASDSRRLGSEG